MSYKNNYDVQEVDALSHIFWDIKDPPSAALGIWMNEDTCQWYYDSVGERDWNIQPLSHIKGFFKLSMITEMTHKTTKTVLMPTDATIKRIVDEIYRSYCATGTFLLEQYTLFGGLKWNERTKTAHVVIKFAG